MTPDNQQGADGAEMKDRFTDHEFANKVEKAFDNLRTVTIPASVLQSVAGACEEVIRISDRGHNAWTDAKNALAALKPYLVK
jgi:hypothetical protein